MNGPKFVKFAKDESTSDEMTADEVLDSIFPPPIDIETEQIGKAHKEPRKIEEK